MHVQGLCFFYSQYSWASRMKTEKTPKNHLISIVSFVPLRSLTGFCLYVFMSTTVKNFKVTSKYLEVDNIQF